MPQNYAQNICVNLEDRWKTGMSTNYQQNGKTDPVGFSDEMLPFLTHVNSYIQMGMTRQSWDKKYAGGEEWNSSKLVKKRERERRAEEEDGREKPLKSISATFCPFPAVHLSKDFPFTCDK